jgi:hypothetical protein
MGRGPVPLWGPRYSWETLLSVYAGYQVKNDAKGKEVVNQKGGKEACDRAPVGVPLRKKAAC